MHLMWRATTYLYLTAVMTGVLIGSARDILTTALLAGVLVLQAAMRRDLDVRTPAASTASRGTRSGTTPANGWPTRVTRR